jgi:putative transposase
MILEAACIESVRLPAHSPNLNPVAERFVHSIKEFSDDRLILIGEASPHRATLQSMLHYPHESNYQGFGNKIIRPEFGEFPREGDIRCRQRLGGLFRYYYRKAA